MASLRAARSNLEWLGVAILAIPAGCTAAAPPGRVVAVPPVSVLAALTPPRAGARAPIDVGAGTEADATAALATDPYAQAWKGMKIRRVVVERRNVFDDEDRPAWLYQTFNSLHVRTQEHVIRRDLLLREGDPYDPELAEETERILRQRDFIATAQVRPVRVEGTDLVDLIVETRDRFTLRAGVSIGIFSGGSQARASLGESNLFGLGKDLSFRYREEESTQYGLRYEDPQFFATFHEFRLIAEDTDEGSHFLISAGLPFRTQESEWSYGARANRSEFDFEYFEQGDTFAEVPLETTGIQTFVSRAFGERNHRRKLGLRIGHAFEEFGAAGGPGAATIDVPQETRSTELGPTFSIEGIAEFREERYIDAVGVTEDVTIGFWLNGFVGLLERNERNATRNRELVVELDARYSGHLGADHLWSIGASGRERFHGGEPQGWNVATQWHYYYRGLPWQTLAASLAFDGAGEREGLPPQLLLGDDSGLRGYPVRYFSGDRRLRINLEDRIFPGISLLQCEVGAVAFFDAGLAWTHGDGVDLSDLHRSVGVGLRIGAPQILSQNVFRLDVAFPLDRNADVDAYELSVSASLGQIFDFFGNSNGFDQGF